VNDAPENEEPTKLDIARGAFKLIILLAIPIFSYVLLKKNKDKISTPEFD
jgi:hypothetical protein